jgi:transposase-like protein
MKQTRRKWSVEQKIQMIQESSTEWGTPVIRIHNVSQSLSHKWQKQFDLNG